jgi:hypothetical protein
MKKILLLLALVLSLNVFAQNAVGDWYIHTSFVGDKVTNVIETNRFVYYLSGSSLFRLDKETQENESLSVVNDLSDMGISQIYYNSEKDYLVVVYSNSNIDIIKSNGSVVNMPEIKDAVLTVSKTINDVTFADGRIYLATDFGYVVIDDSKLVIKESHLYGEKLTTVAQLGNMLLLSTTDKFYYGDASAYHDQLSSFRSGSFKSNCRIRPISDNTCFCFTSRVYYGTMTVDENGKAKFTADLIIDGRTTEAQRTVNGGFLINVPSSKVCYTTDENGLNPVATETDGEMCSSHPSGDGSKWAAGPLGLHILGNENYYKPNALSFDMPFWMTYNKPQDLLYVTPPSANGFFTTTSPTAVGTYDGIKWNDITPEGAPENGCYWVEFLPDAPNTYFLGTWRDGLLKVVDNKIVFQFDSTNSPLKKQYAMHPVTTIDRFGNVWVAQPLENKDHTVMVLPAAKAKQSEPLKSDWILPEIEGISTGHTQRCSFLSTKNSSYDIKIFTDGDFEMPVFFWNSGGELSLHPQQVSFKQLIDQDGQPFSWTNIMCLTEDLSGVVWMGCTEGVVSFNPAQAFSGDFRVNHIKVPRNDGTNMADYLLDGIQVNDVAVDGANRKWIATQSSGLFLVSADGSQIINRFNTTNSPLASNTVYKVCCNPNSNSVYLTTPAGLFEYFSDSSPAESSYDNIYAYPNPVRPEYTGDVTIVGLMDNSLVKIADAGGNVIRQLKSTGGMVTWDCCNQYGERAKTGVYMVLCSQANGGSEAVVTKIAVIR